MTIRQQKLTLGIVFLGVPLAWLLIWVVLPIFGVFYLSFTQYDILTPPEWIGMWNYEDLWYDRLYWKAFGNTLYFTAVAMPTSVFLSLMLALLVNRKFKGAWLFRTIYYLPVVSPLIATALVWILFYEVSTGLFNYLLRQVGISPLGWLTSPAFAMPGVIAMSVWKGLGFNMVIFLAALQAVPRELHEAAAIDGADKIRQFWSITLPLLRPAMTYVLITTLISSFQVFAQVYVMTNGGPNNSTVTLVHLIYRTAFQNLDFGYASAMAVVLFFILVIASFINLRLVSRGDLYN